jgi:hypothetical protein
MNICDSKKVTLFITSCGRPNLLKITLESFLKYNSYPIEEVILCEDSGHKGIVDFVKDILPYKITFCYNETRIGQMKTIGKYSYHIRTPYVFHLEDDWLFYDYGFIELSFRIMDSDPNISQVLLPDQSQIIFKKININNPLCYKVTTVGYKEDRELNVFSWNPGLKHLDIAMLRIPYEPWDDEYTIQLAVNKLGKYAVIPNHDNRSIKGFCKHIGANDHINNIIKGTNEIIIGRQHFPDKQEIQLKDI